MVCQPPPVRRSERWRADGLGGAFPVPFDSLGVDRGARQRRFHRGEEEEVAWRQVRWIGRMIDHLNASGVQKRLGRARRMKGRIIPVEQPLPWRHGVALPPENLQKLGQDC